MNYQLIRSRRRSISMQIKGGELIVRAPNRMPQREIDRFLADHAQWIETHMAASQAAQAEAGGKLTQEQLETLVELAKDAIPRRVVYWAQQMGISYGRITIRAQRTRWGSCTAEGNLNFNCLLLLAPPEVLDSVVVHELCHRRQMNHSDQFYREVLKVMPDYHAHHRWLKEHGEALLLRLP